MNEVVYKEKFTKKTQERLGLKDDAPRLKIKKPKKPKKKGIFEVTLDVNGETFHAADDTLSGAITSVNPRLTSDTGFYHFKTKSSLTVKKGDQYITQYLFPRQLRRIFGKFAPPFVLKILVERLERGLHDNILIKSPLEL